MNSQIPPEAVTSAFQLVSYVFTAVARGKRNACQTRPEFGDHAHGVKKHASSLAGASGMQTTNDANQDPTHHGL